ncbi:hypothetical protein FQR65_LT15916 [Abscondita terminalis]|nr:hypothetical protein FQR65_LT15916 [Abscondita terminalis]
MCLWNRSDIGRETLEDISLSELSGIPPYSDVLGSAKAGPGVWISHGEGKFNLPQSEDQYQIVAKYAYQQYPANPNGSDYNTAMLCDKTGRHLVRCEHRTFGVPVGLGLLSEWSQR